MKLSPPPQDTDLETSMSTASKDITPREDHTNPDDRLASAGSARVDEPAPEEPSHDEEEVECVTLSDCESRISEVEAEAEETWVQLQFEFMDETEGQCPETS